MLTQKKDIPAHELEQEIIAFLMARATHSGGAHSSPGCNLRHGKACVLATCHDNVPRATPVDFFCDGSLAIWISAEPGGKIANIMRNPQAAAGIYDPVDHSIEQKSLQLWGTAELINLKNNPGLFMGKLRQFGLDEAMAGIIDELAERGIVPSGALAETTEKIKKMINLVKITPTKVSLLHMKPDGLPIKKIWKNGTATEQIGLI
ncbi:MAG: pyridoxamine 5'-phosphate oxidase family protein [Deltaproteobacteria bacterium]|nr:pyridoxamine 5'-phosphate oxidase family protein [Deltaproteobacteria bacterium]